MAEKMIFEGKEVVKKGGAYSAPVSENKPGAPYINRGAANLTIREEDIGDIGGEIVLKSLSFDIAGSYYQIAIEVGADNVEIESIESEDVQDDLSVMYATLGFIIAYVFLEGFRSGMYESGLSFEYTPDLIAGFFIAALFISVCGAVFALGRVTKVEPASVFRM